MDQLGRRDELQKEWRQLVVATKGAPDERRIEQIREEVYTINEQIRAEMDGKLIGG